jgi:hypothetical protein
LDTLMAVSGQPRAATSRWWRGGAVVGAVLLVVLGALVGVELSRQLGHPPSHSPAPASAAVVNDSLVITHPDGSRTVINLSTLNLQGATTKALFTGDTLYLTDRAGGTITRLDPATGTTIGTAWHAGTPVADAAVDGLGTVWALTTDGQLHHLTWANDTLIESVTPTTVDGAGARSLLVPNATGVTVLAQEAGLVVRVGTTQDGQLSVPQLSGQLDVPVSAPVDLVPVSLVDTGFVLLIGPGSATLVAMGPYGCDHPGQPAVQAGHIYIACLGTGKVIVLDPAGTHTQPDIVLGPTGDPVLTIVGGRLAITLPGAPGVTIDALGTSQATTTAPPDVSMTTVGSGGGAGPPPVVSGTSAPPPAPPAIHGGDIVVQGVIADAPTSVFSNCPVVGGTCQFWVYPYTANLAPPAAWSSFNGTCTLIVTGGPGNQPIACSATSVHLGIGNGATWSVAVQACTSNVCVTSNTVSVVTKAPTLISG